MSQDKAWICPRCGDEEWDEVPPRCLTCGYDEHLSPAERFEKRLNQARMTTSGELETTKAQLQVCIETIEELLKK